MTRILGQYVSLEMALLCAVELLLSFLLIYTMLQAASLTGLAPWAIGPDATNLAALLAFSIATTAVAIGLYRPELCLQSRRLLLNAAIAGVAAYPVALLVSGSLHISLSRSYLIWLSKVLIAWIACVLVTRWVFAAVIRHDLFSRRVLVVGAGSRADRVRELLRAQRTGFFQVAAPPIPAGGSAADADAAFAAQLRGDRLWGVVVAAEEHGALPVRALLDCKLRGMRVLDDVTFWERHLGRIDLDHVGADWMLFADGFESGPVGRAVKRGSDLLFGGVLLLLTLPLMLLTALAIKLDSPGPVFYRQQRVGLHGKPFTLCKFRSMRRDAEVGGSPRWAAQKDPRITRIGGFIRATRMDELPQLINVLSGEMSFIGPRPERPQFVEQLARIIPFYQERSYVKPGITGWAQVNFPYGASVEDAREKLSYDLYYVKNRNLFLDLMILISTVRVILFQEGAR